MSVENSQSMVCDVADIATEAVNDNFIKSRIFTIRGVQVMLDCDLASLYGVETRALNQAVKRNVARFPESFMFQLDRLETENWKSQIVTSNLDKAMEARIRMGVRRAPYAFTEQGIAMLSAVLRSKMAIATSVRIMNVFVAMRKALASIAPVLVRLDNVERRQIADQLRNDESQRRNEERFDTIFKAMDEGDFPSQKVFYEGKHYEAYSFAKKLVRRAMKDIVLVDAYCDEVTLYGQGRRGVPRPIPHSRRQGTLSSWRILEGLGTTVLRHNEDGRDVHSVDHAKGERLRTCSRPLSAAAVV